MKDFWHKTKEHGVLLEFCFYLLLLGLAATVLSGSTESVMFGLVCIAISVSLIVRTFKKK